MLICKAAKADQPSRLASPTSDCIPDTLSATPTTTTSPETPDSTPKTPSLNQRNHTLANMPISSRNRLLRRTAVTIIILLQSVHFVLQMHDRWTHPQRLNRFIITLAKFNELVFFSFCSFKLAEWNYGVKIGRHVIRGARVDALLWAMGAWSAAVVLGEGRGLAGEMLGLVQLISMDLILWAEILNRGVAWVEEGEGAEGEVVEEMVGSEKGEKQEV